MPDGDGYNGGGYGVGFARNIPSVQTRVVEAGENRLLVEQSLIIFVASLMMMVVLYGVLNSAAYEMTWLWQVLVRGALVVPAALAGMVVTWWFLLPIVVSRRGGFIRFTEVPTLKESRNAHIYATLASFLVWWFLAGGKIAFLEVLPFGEVADYLIKSFDFPEGHQLGTVIVALWRALGAGVLVSLVVALLPLIARMRRELADIHHGALELEKARMLLAWEREKFYALHPEAEEPVEGEVVASRPIPVNGPATRRTVTTPVLPPAADVLTGHSARAGKEVDVPADVVRHVLDLVWREDRTLARKHWASDERVTLAQWEVIVSRLEETKLSNGKRLVVSPDVIMQKFGLASPHPTPPPGNGGGTAENARNGTDSPGPSRPVPGEGEQGGKQ